MTDQPGLVYSGSELETMSAAINYHRWIVDRIAPYLGRRVAEVGAGIGSVSKLLLERGVEELWSFEPSRNMFPHLQRALSTEPRARLINDFFRREYTADGIDSAVYINVMEHIEDDRGEFATAREGLHPGGHLLVFVPALSWLYSDFDKELGHFRRYTKRSLMTLASQTGFNVVDARYFDVAGILPWYVSFRLLKGRPRVGAVSLYDRLVVPPMRRIESFLPPPIGKSLLLVARKPTQ